MQSVPPTESSIPVVLIVADCDRLSPCEKEVLQLTEQLTCRVEYFTRIEELPNFKGKDSSHIMVQIHWTMFARHMLGSLSEVQQRIERTRGIPASQIHGFGTRFAPIHTKAGAASFLATT